LRRIVQHFSIEGLSATASQTKIVGELGRLAGGLARRVGSPNNAAGKPAG
jgi:hypothetical protein